MEAGEKPANPPLTREQIGPFFLLGIDKEAELSQVEVRWAQRVIWARKSEVPTHLGDVNWAREVLNDPERRISADVSSFNADTSDRALARLAERYALETTGKPAWPVLDREKPLSDYVPPTEIPNPDAVLAGIKAPEAPPDSSMVLSLLRQFVHERLDPWKVHNA
jgi:hypothetical protein